MATNTGGLGCAATSWAIAGLLGVISFVMLMLLGDWTFLQAAFVAIIVIGAGGAFITWAFCTELPPPVSVSAAGAGTARSAAPDVTPAAAPAAPVASAAPAPAPEPAPVPAASEAPEPEAPAAEPEKPALLSQPEGTPDDLKQIKGVGPVLEKKLNDMGIFHYRQIAAWTDKEIAWVDDSLNFKGRIARDGWIEQATTLAAGGTTEYSTRSPDRPGA